MPKYDSYKETEREEWRDIKRTANRGIWWFIGWIALVTLIVFLIGILIWGISVAVSGPKGQGDAVIEKNSSENFIKQQAAFEQNYQEIKTTDQKIVIAYDASVASPDDKTLQQTYTGLQSYCLSKVAEYNADARSFLSEDFKAADLPSEINTNDAATDCKP